MEMERKGGGWVVLCWKSSYFDPLDGAARKTLARCTRFSR